jgi:hypothetical protein
MLKKEFRALLPLWLATVAAMLLASASGRAYQSLAGLAFLLGAAALGGFSFAHEYPYRTMDSLLTLPVPRAHVWRAKMTVLLILLVSLAALGLSSQAFGRPTLLVVILAIGAAAGLSPWLALISRNALGGAVFSVSIAGILLVTAQIVGVRLYGYTSRVDDFVRSVMTVGIATLSALGVVMSWRTFARLEVAEGVGAEVVLPFLRSSSAASSRRTHPVWLLVRKELRIQALAWVVALLYIGVYIGVFAWSRDRANVANSVTILTLLYSSILALVIGSLAGGEERQTGVHDAQLLLPMRTRTQWIVKVATALGLASVLTVALPLALIAVLPPEMTAQISRRVGRGGIINPGTVVVFAFMVTLGLYVSTLVGAGLRGLIASIPVGMGFLYVSVRFIDGWSYQAAKYVRSSASDRLYYYEPLLPRNAEPYVLAVVFGLFLLVVLRLALTNYRWADRPPMRIAGHAAIALTAEMACFTLLTVLGIR